MLQGAVLGLWFFPILHQSSSFLKNNLRAMASIDAWEIAGMYNKPMLKGHAVDGLGWLFGYEYRDLPTVPVREMFE